MSTNKIRYFGREYKVPQWAAYIATDCSGAIWIYDEVPIPAKDMWARVYRGNRYHVGVDVSIRSRWKESCQPIKDLIIPPKPLKPKVGKVAPHVSNEVRLVLAGTKPLASIEKYKDQYGYALAISLANAGSLYKEVVSESEVVITLPNNKALVGQWRWLLDHGVKTYGLHEFHRQMGLLYGYTEEDINTFIRSDIKCECNKCVGNKST